MIYTFKKAYKICVKNRTLFLRNIYFFLWRNCEENILLGAIGRIVLLGYFCSYWEEKESLKLGSVASNIDITDGLYWI